MGGAREALPTSENVFLVPYYIKKFSENIFAPFNWKLLKLGSVSVKDIRKNVPILQVGGSTLAPPILPVIRLVLLHKWRFV